MSGVGDEVLELRDEVGEHLGPGRGGRAGVVLLVVESAVGVRLPERLEGHLAVTVGRAEAGRVRGSRVVLEALPGAGGHGASIGPAHPAGGGCWQGATTLARFAP